MAFNNYFDMEIGNSVKLELKHDVYVEVWRLAKILVYESLTQKLYWKSIGSLELPINGSTNNLRWK